MKCLRRGIDMTKCRIWGDRYRLKWNYEDEGTSFGVWVVNGPFSRHRWPSFAEETLCPRLAMRCLPLAGNRRAGELTLDSNS
jgi:hypothetical protein